MHQEHRCINYFATSHRFVEQVLFFTDSLETETKVRGLFGVYRASVIFGRKARIASLSVMGERERLCISMVFG